jgi:cell division protein FtsB
VSEKSEILDAIDPVITPPPMMGLPFLIVFLLVVSIVLLAVFPKIYLQTQIYYKSRDIAVLQHEYNTLKEENYIIKKKVETIRFKNQILDTLF